VIKPDWNLGVMLCALVCVAGTQALAADTADRHFALADHGSLQLKVPTEWHEDIKQEPDRLLPTIVITPTARAPFGVIVTPIWPTEKDAPNPDRKALQELMQQGADAIKPQSVEQSIEIKPLEVVSGVGYYFSVTDRAPKAGGYKHLTQGMVPVGELIITFGIYTNDGQEEIVTDVLTMLKTAAYSANKAD
jgi:hypothetical protein